MTDTSTLPEPNEHDLAAARSALAEMMPLGTAIPGSAIRHFAATTIAARLANGWPAPPDSGETGAGPIKRDGEDGMTARLCQAFGIDPAKFAGFELVVQGGQWPMIRAYQLLETNDAGRPSSAPVDRVEAMGPRMALVPADSPIAAFLDAGSDGNVDITIGQVVKAVGANFPTDELPVYVQPVDDQTLLRPGAKVLIVQSRSDDEVDDGSTTT